MSLSEQRVVRSPLVGYALVLTAAVLFGLNAGASRIPLRSGTDEVTFTTVRITAALVVLVVVALVGSRSGSGALMVLLSWVVVPWAGLFIARPPPRGRGTGRRRW